MNNFSHVPPGFRFHPTDEELVDYYLRKKVTSRRIDLDVIKDVDLYKIEPWDLQEICRLGTEEQNEWYFFSHKDKKYPTGTRTNRATAAGFWKATGRDKAIYSKHDLIGMRKTLVFYKGRAPNGQKSDWIMHEYRLETDENGIPQEEGWVVCRVFKKRVTTTMRKVNENDQSPCWYDDQLSFMESPSKQHSYSQLSFMESPSKQHSYSHPYHHLPYQFSCKKEQLHDLHYQVPHDHVFQLPLLKNHKMQLQTTNVYGLDMMNNGSTNLQSSSRTQDQEQNMQQYSLYGNRSNSTEQAVDWRVLDKFVASQLSQEESEVSRERNYTNPNANAAANNMYNHASQSDQVNSASARHYSMPENASTSSSSCQIDLWK